MRPDRTKPRAWPVVLLAALAGAASLYLPAGLLIVPALFAYAGARTRPSMLALAAAPFAIGAFLLYTPVAAAGLLLVAAGGAAVLYALQIRRAGNAYTALTLAGVILVGLYASVCLPGIVSGDGAFAAVQSSIDGLLDFYRGALTQVADLDAETAATLNEYIDAFSEAVPTFVVPALCVFAGAMGLGNFLFFRLFCRKHAEIRLMPMRPFRLWALPRSMMYGLFALLIGSLILEWSGWQFATSLSNTVNVLVGMPLILQGLCVLDFLLARSRRNVATARTLTYVAVALLFSVAQMPLALLGCFEQLFRFRDRLQHMPPRTAG